MNRRRMRRFIRYAVRPLGFVRVLVSTQRRLDVAWLTNCSTRRPPGRFVVRWLARKLEPEITRQQKEQPEWWISVDLSKDPGTTAWRVTPSESE